MSNVRLVGITKPEGWTGCENANDLVAYTARVSNPSNQRNFDTSSRLIKYLVREQHWSPFEMVHVVMEIKTTRDISRQILRHRSFSFQEFSQRYATAEEFISNREFRLQDTKNRQNSIEVQNSVLQGKWSAMQEVVLAAAKQAYSWAKNEGLAKEQSRSVLPEGLTETTVYMSGTLRSWIHYCDLRSANGTQKEHRDIAIQAWNIIKEQFPDIVEAVTLINLEKEVAASKLEVFDYISQTYPEILEEASKARQKISLDKST